MLHFILCGHLLRTLVSVCQNCLWRTFGIVFGCQYCHWAIKKCFFSLLVVIIEVTAASLPSLPSQGAKHTQTPWITVHRLWILRARFHTDRERSAATGLASGRLECGQVRVYEPGPTPSLERPHWHQSFNATRLIALIPQHLSTQTIPHI